jgi:hypothetical protein
MKQLWIAMHQLFCATAFPAYRFLIFFFDKRSYVIGGGGRWGDTDALIGRRKRKKNPNAIEETEKRYVNVQRTSWYDVVGCWPVRTTNDGRWLTTCPRVRRYVRSDRRRPAGRTRTGSPFPSRTVFWPVRSDIRLKRKIKIEKIKKYLSCRSESRVDRHELVWKVAMWPSRWKLRENCWARTADNRCTYGY